MRPRLRMGQRILTKRDANKTVAALAALFKHTRDKYPTERLATIFSLAYGKLYNSGSKSIGALIGDEFYYPRYIPKGTAKFVLKEIGVWPPAKKGRKRYRRQDMGDGWYLMIDREDFYRVLHEHPDGSVWYSRMLLDVMTAQGDVINKKLGRGCVKCREQEPAAIKAFTFVNSMGKHDDE